MPFITAGDIVVHYDLEGPHDRPVVMLSNSLGTNLHMWDEQINALVRHRRVLRYDMRGHGLTDTTPNDDPSAATIARLGEDAVALLDALGIAQVDFIGLSIGGMVAQRVAATHPDRVRALVVCAAGSRAGTPDVWNVRIDTVRRDGPGALAEQTMERWFTPFMFQHRPETIAGFANMVRRTPREGYVACASAVRDADLRDDGASIRARTLIVCGAHDPTASPEVGEALRAVIPGARLHVMASSAHMVCAEQPVEFNQVVTSFLEAS